MALLKNIAPGKPASPHLLTSLRTWVGGLTSENWGGLCGFAGDTAVLLTGDIPSIASTAFCFVAEGTFIRAGQKAWGYSMGAAAFAAAYVALLTSATINSGPFIRDVLIAQTAFWAIGALRAPLTSIAQRLDSPFLRRVADGIQKPVGLGTSAGAATLLVSSTVHAATAGSPHAWVLPLASTLWTAHNVLSGRVQELLFPAKKGPATAMQEAVQGGKVPVRSLSLPAPKTTCRHHQIEK